MTFKTSTNDSAATQKLGRQIGRLIKGGCLIELVGDIGSGKTTLAQGILAGLGYEGEAPSPTFTLERVYPISAQRYAYHADLHRLERHDLVTSELAEVIKRSDSVVLAEWPGNGRLVLPPDRVRIRLEPAAQANGREIAVEGLGPHTKTIVQELQRVSRA